MRLASTFAIALLSTAAAQASGLITADIYQNFTCCSGGGAPYSNLVGILTSSDIQFGTTTGFNWHPFALAAFGADIRGTLQVSSASTYTFSVNADDGAELFIDGALVVSDGGEHPPDGVTGNAALAAGLHGLEVQFFENGVGDSGIDVHLPAGVIFGVPEPASALLAGLGLAALVGFRRRRSIFRR